MVKYHPSEYKYKGTGRYYYIKYEHLEHTRNGLQVWKPRVKRVFISGKLIKKQIGTFVNKYGRHVHGVKLVYENTRSGYKRRAFIAHRNRKYYRVSSAKIPKTRIVVSKIVELPKNSRKIKIVSSRKAVEPTLPNVS